MTSEVQARRPTVLVVEDDQSICLGLEMNLRRAGYAVRLAPHGSAALAMLQEDQFDLVLLDLMLPEVDGLEVLRRIRQQDDRLPVIILTAMGTEPDKVRGLDLGANDYVTKPFSIAELMARVRAALRVAQGVGEAGDEGCVLRAGGIELYQEARKVVVDGREVSLKAREYDLLQFLMERPERVLTRDQILANLWGDEYEGTDRTVDNYVSALRKKLGEDLEHPRHLRTVWGIGYRFVP